jgi:hypothetical protein
VVLLEPNTEGRLAATLARVGEGPAALYLQPVHATLARIRDELRRAGRPTSVIGEGPFGRQALVLGRPAWGPHVLLVDTAATIAR